MVLGIERGEPLAHLRDEMDRLISNFWGGLPRPAALRGLRAAAFPAFDVWETQDDLYFEAELPGVKESDLDITVSGGEITLRGRREPRQGDEATYHRRERGTGAFSRSLRLPVEVDAERIEATLADGVLLVKLPKSEAAKPRRIEVRTRS